MVKRMPGLSLLLGEKLSDASLKDLKHETYINVNKIEHKDFSLVFSGFNGYPFFKKETKDYLIYLEGKIYNKTDKEIEQDLVSLINSYLNEGNFKKLLKNFVRSSSGDFLVFIYFFERKSFLFFNDRWGRLQSFYYHKNNVIIISREIKFILHYLDHIHYDKIGLIEHLAIRYTFGDQTIFNNIKRTLPGYLLSNNQNGFLAEENLPNDFSLKPYKDYSKEEYVKKAKDILLKSTKECLSKTQEYYRCIDLSGGYDSRAIFSSAYLEDESVIPISINLISGDESSVAEKVVDVYKTQLKRINPIRDLSQNSVMVQIYKTDGLVDGRITGGCYPNRKYLNLEYDGPVASYMGFGGEFLRHPKVYRKFHKSIIDVIKIDSFPLLVSNSIINNICRCLNYKQKDIYNHWREFFGNHYKESKMADKIAHFYFDYYRIFVGQGEDRARIHVWTVNPMMSNDWLLFSNTIIPRQFCDYDFFEQLLVEIDEKVSVANIPIWQLGFKRSNLYKYIVTHKFTINLGKFITKIIWMIKSRRTSERKNLIEATYELYNSSTTIQNLFNIKDIRRFHRNEFGPNNWFIWQLYSTFLYMKIIEERFPTKVLNQK